MLLNMVYPYRPSRNLKHEGRGELNLADFRPIRGNETRGRIRQGVR